MTAQCIQPSTSFTLPGGHQGEKHIKELFTSRMKTLNQKLMHNEYTLVEERVQRQGKDILVQIGEG